MLISVHSVFIYDDGVTLNNEQILLAEDIVSFLWSARLMMVQH